MKLSGVSSAVHGRHTHDHDREDRVMRREMHEHEQGWMVWSGITMPYLPRLW